MAKVTLILEDMPNGQVSISGNPPREYFTNKVRSGHDFTPAEAYMLRAIRSVQEDSKKSYEDFQQERRRNSPIISV